MHEMPLMIQMHGAKETSQTRKATYCVTPVGNDLLEVSDLWNINISTAVQCAGSRGSIAQG